MADVSHRRVDSRNLFIIRKTFETSDEKFYSDNVTSLSSLQCLRLVVLFLDRARNSKQSNNIINPRHDTCLYIVTISGVS